MQEVIMTVGIPACGKTTHALNWLKESPKDRARVNRDDIRAMIGDSSQHNSSTEFEGLVTNVQDQILWQHLKSGRSVIIDNTHLHPKYFEQITEQIQNFANQFNVVLGLKVVVLDVDYDTCIARNSNRDRVVPERIIYKMYDNFKRIKTYIAINYRNIVVIRPK